MRKLFVTLSILALSLTSAQAVSNRTIRADMSFMDFEDLSGLFKTKYKQVVRKINHADSPVKIVEAEVSDKGTNFFKGFVGVRNTFKVKVKNTSHKDVLAYQVSWVLKHPFEDYIFHRILTNSIHVLKPGKTQELSFKKNKHYRDDAYYYLEITKVEFDGVDEYWEAPEIEDYKQHTQLENVKKEIDEMGEDMDLSNPDNIDLDTLKEQYGEGDSSKKEPETEEELEGKVELEEITSTEAETVTEEAPIEETIIEETITEETVIEESSSQPIIDIDNIDPEEITEEQLKALNAQSDEYEYEIVEEVIEIDGEETLEEMVEEIIEEKVEVETSEVEASSVETIEEVIEEAQEEIEEEIKEEVEELIEETQTIQTQEQVFDDLRLETQKLIKETETIESPEVDIDLDEDFDFEDDDDFFIDDDWDEDFDEDF